MNETELINKLKNISNDEIELFSLNNLITKGKIVDIYDGDTCKIILIVDNTLKKFNCRLLGIDTPEMKPLLSKPNRDLEIIGAHRCRNKILQLLTSCECLLDCQMDKSKCKKFLEKNNKIITVKCYEFDKYGRLLVELFYETNSKSVNQILVDEGFAKSYDGGTKEGFSY
jgi:endonuclease YncB( thermonuclease family)